MKSSVLALLVVALAGAACGSSDSTTAPSTPTSSGTFEVFTSLLVPQGSAFYSFTVTAAETVSLALVSLSPGNNDPASTAVVRLGLGVPLGTDCTVSTSVDTAAGLTTQLTSMVNPDIYCVRIADIGNLPTPMNFTVRIGHNATSVGSTAPAVTETFTSFLAFMGSSGHSFTVSQSGTISATLTSVTPAVAIGVGIGIPASGAPTCTLTSSVNATAGSTPPLTVPVDAGTYCVQAFDPGTLSITGASFSITITHP